MITTQIETPTPTITRNIIEDIFYQYGFFSTLPYKEFCGIFFFHGSPTHETTRDRRCVVQFRPWGVVKFTLECPQKDYLVHFEASTLRELCEHSKFTSEFLHVKDS